MLKSWKTVFMWLLKNCELISWNKHFVGNTELAWQMYYFALGLLSSRSVVRKTTAVSLNCLWQDFMLYIIIHVDTFLSLSNYRTFSKDHALHSSAAHAAGCKTSRGQQAKHLIETRDWNSESTAVQCNAALEIEEVLNLLKREKNWKELFNLLDLLWKETSSRRMWTCWPDACDLLNCLQPGHQKQKQMVH